MHYEPLSQAQGLALQQKAPYAWIRTQSSVYLGENPGTLPPSPLLEARFFAPRQELRLTAQGDYLSVTYDASDDVMDECYLVENERFGKELTVCHILSADEDGQSYIATTCLAGWKGA